MKKSKRIKINYRLIILLITSLLLVISNIYFIISLLRLTGIETLIRMIVIFILILLVLCFNIRYLKSYYLKKKRFNIYTILLIIYSIIFFGMGTFIQNALNTLNNLTTNKTTYSVSVITLENPINENIKNTDEKVGIISDNDNIEKELTNEIISTNKIKNIVEYSDYISLINALKNNEVQYIVLPSNYYIRFQNVDGLNINLEKDTKIIYTITKEVESKTKNRTLTEPFTILLMGVDSELEDINGAVFNGDALMLVTFNPNTLSTTILSIPRDSYVPIACFQNQKRNKITHAAWYGETCMINTIENFLDIPIDYYVKVNFKGVVKLVDTLGGIEMKIPYNLCEQNSNREWGENTIYIEEGYQLLNGEQALAYARNRHPNPSYCSSKWTNYISNDFIRGQHQQEVLKAILNKLKSIDSLDMISSLLNTISNNLETNMSTPEILSLYNVGKDILTSSFGNVEDLISIQRLYLSGIDAYIYEPSSKLTLYNYVLYDESIEEVSNAMKENLEIKEKAIIKSFSFDSTEEYEEKVIGKGEYNKLPDYKIIPDFIGDSKYQSSITAKALGIRVSYIYDENGDGAIGTVIKQSVAPGTLLSKSPSIILTIKKEKEVINNENEANEKKDDNKKEEDLGKKENELKIEELFPKEE